VVLPLVPVPADRGDRLRAREMLEGLGSVGEVAACLVLRPGEEVPGPEAWRGLGEVAGVLALDRRALALGAAWGLLTGRPPAVVAFWHVRRFRARGLPPPGPWDLVVAFGLRAAPYARLVPARARVLELTDSLSLYRRGLPPLGRALLQRVLLTGVERLEARWPHRFDATVVSAPADAAEVEALAGIRPTVIPNGARALPAPLPPRERGPLLFVGDMRYPPNEDGVCWFVRRVWPLLRVAFPELRLRLVGRTTPRVEALRGVAGVEVVGYVPDLGPEWDAAMALVNPVRWGAGSQRKVLDALAVGRPVVSTRAGLRGIPVFEGLNALAADRPGEWVEAVRQLWTSPGTLWRLGRSGWELARTALDARAAWARLARSLLEGAGQEGRPGSPTEPRGDAR
jgi:glycosyltransferase involved in cell wall biosynthesis